MLLQGNGQRAPTLKDWTNGVQNIFVREKLTFILLGLNYKGLKVTGKYGFTLLQLSGKTLGTV